MKLLVLAQTPPPLHGQSFMVEALVAGLSGDRGIGIFHVNLRLSQDSADIGRWRLGKLASLLTASARALRVRLKHGAMYLYYVPAPAKRGALYRDWLVMLICRPFFNGLVLHWHAAGLGHWLTTQATAPERWLSERLLGRARLAIVLGEALRADAEALMPRRVAIVRNGIADPCPNFVRQPRAARAPIEALFLGLCIAEKGVFDAISGVIEANRRAGRTIVRLTVAGSFPNAEAKAAYDAIAGDAAKEVRHAGFVSGDVKHRLLMDADALIFPTTYGHETQGLVVVEALAYDLPVIVTRWRAVHENLPSAGVAVVEPHRSDQIASALLDIFAHPPPAGVRRHHFLETLTLPRYLADIRGALVQAETAE